MAAAVAVAISAPMITAAISARAVHPRPRRDGRSQPALATATWMTTSRAERALNEPWSVAGRRARDFASRARGDDSLRARPRSIRRAKGYIASPHDRLDLGFADDGGGGHFVLDSLNSAGRTLEPDPSAV